MSPEPRTAATAPVFPASGYLLLAGLTLFWGFNWPVMKIVVAEIPVWTFRSLCLIVGGGALLAIAKLGGRSLRVPTNEVRPLLLCAAFNIVGWHILSGYGVAMIDSGRAAIIAFTMPVWAAFLGRIVLNERFTWTGGVGLALGVLGLGVLIGTDFQRLGAAPIGSLMMLGAALSWAAGTVFMKRYTWSIPVGVLAGWQLIAGALPITLGALVIERIPDPMAISYLALAALLYVLALPMVFCHWAWFAIVRMFPAPIAATSTLAIPIVGVISGALVLGEPIGGREILALTLVCAALVVVLVLPAALQAGRRGRSD